MSAENEQYSAPPPYATTADAEIPKIPGPPRQPPPPYKPAQVQVTRPQLQTVVQNQQMQMAQGQMGFQGQRVVQGQQVGLGQRQAGVVVQNQPILISPMQIHGNAVMQVQPQTIFAPPVCIVPSIGEDPCSLHCLNCRKQITTSVSYVAGDYAWRQVWILVLISLFVHCLLLGCCFIPLCIDSNCDVEHRCPICGTHLGTYRRQ